MTEASATTLVAVRADTGERLTIGDAPTESLRLLSDHRLLHCPDCGGMLTLKAGPLRVHHFAHTSLAQCADPEREPETDSHRQGKLLLYSHFRKGAQTALVERHFPATNQRADVYVEMPDGLRYALEFQQANNSLERWLDRHNQYTDQGIHDIWFLGQSRYNESYAPHAISAYDPLPVPRDVFGAASGAFRIRELERALLAANPELLFLEPESAILTVLLARDVRNYTLLAYRYRLPLAECVLKDGRLWTPLDPHLESYRRYMLHRHFAPSVPDPDLDSET